MYNIIRIKYTVPVRGSPASIMRSAGTFISYVYTAKITQLFRWLGITIIVNFTFAVCEPAHNNSCDPLSKKLGCPWYITWCLYRVSVKSLCTCARRVLHCAGSGKVPYNIKFRWYTWPLSHACEGHLQNCTAHSTWHPLWSIPSFR
jgi:hypothetical protein